MGPPQSRRPNSQYRERDIVARNLDVGRDLADHHIGATSEEPEYYAESPPMAPPNYARYSGAESHKFVVGRPSMSKRVLRTVARFASAVLVGVGATLGWQSYGDRASTMIRTWAPSLTWLLPDATAASPVAPATLPEFADQLKPISLDLAIVRRTLEQLAANQNQLAAKQDQIAQNVATLQEVEQELRQGVHTQPRKPLSSTPQSLH
jgi:hypothetical protein